MTATIGTNGRATSSRPGKGPAVVPKGQLGVPSRSRRPARWALAAGLAAVVVLLGLGNVALVSATSQRSSFLTMARPVAAGQIIRDADVGIVDLSGASGLRALPASQRSAIVGHAATVALPAGSLVPPDAVAAPSGLAAGQTLVALGLKSGQYPPGLRQGDHVMIVGTGSGAGGVTSGASGTNDAAGSLLVGDARVMAVDQAAPGSGSTSAVVSVAVDAAAAPRVAGAASVGKVTLALLSGAAGQ